MSGDTNCGHPIPAYSPAYHQLCFQGGAEPLGSPGALLLQPGAVLGVPQCAKRPSEGFSPESCSLLLGVSVPAFWV